MFRKTLIGVASATLLSAAMADTVKMNGATTVLNVVIKPTQAAVEKATGHTLQIVGNATGKGLVDLASGDADVAMVSEPIEIALEAAQAAGKTLDPKTLQFAVVKKDEVVFTINAANPVHKLTFDQLRDIHIGKITNWKEVVLRGADYGSNVKAQTSVKRAAELVSTDEAGIAGVGKGFVVEGKAKIVETTKIERPLGFVTIGAPKPAVKAVIEAFAKEAAGL